MSFTVEVKDELSRVPPTCDTCSKAELSAMVRICGTLTFHGSGSYSLSVSTETGPVARTVFNLVHRLFGLDTSYMARRSRLHKTRNHLIEMKPQPGLEEALQELGILVPGRGLVPGVPSHLLGKECCRAAFVRGAFMAGGFVANPRNDFHMEVAVTGEEYALGLIDVISSLGVTARLNRRRGAFAVYVKSFDDEVALLRAMGATRSPRAVENVRFVKSKRNDANRMANADMANINRATEAAAGQLALIERAERTPGLSALPRALREFCEARRAHPELSLAELGQEMDPPVSKGALYHRLLRLQQVVEEAEGQAGTGAGPAAPARPRGE